MKRTVNNRT